MSYTFRLASLSLASFVLVLVAAEALIAAFSGKMVRFASRLEARTAARLLFAVRLAPAALAIFVVAALCVPSYLWLEPSTAENVGAFGIAAAVLSLALWMRSAARAGRALLESWRYLRVCRQSAREVAIGGKSALLVDRNRTTVLAGLFRPVVVVSSDVAAVLSIEQLEAAARHERSHAASHDNLKRLAILLAPGLLPLLGIEQAWKKFSEWAADDLAVAGDRARALVLAEALVRVARIGVGTRPVLSTSLLGEDFSARIDRLLAGAPRTERLRWRTAAVVGAALAAILLRPATLSAVHQALEKLIR